MLATTSTVGAAADAFEQSENVAKAHPKIQITDAHAELARRRGPEQADGKVKGRLGLRVGGLMKVVRDLKG